MLKNKLDQIIKVLVCPECHEPLNRGSSFLECSKCRRKFFIRDDVTEFIPSDLKEVSNSSFHDQQYNNTTFLAKLYNCGKKIITSEYRPRDNIREFVDDIEEGRIIVEFGSGCRRLRDDVINVDLFKFPNVDVVADMSRPFADNAVDFVILDSVIEHIPYPQKFMEDLYRILKPGGQVICVTTFVFPYHGYPKHYFNFSEDGLKILFEKFSNLKVEMHMGPTVAWINLFAESFAVAFSGKSNFLYTFLKGAALLPIFLFKYLDKLWLFLGGRMKVSSQLCAWASK